MEKVAVIGASEKEDRYSNKAMKMLTEYGHEPIPVSPSADEILGKKVYKSLSDINEPIDTVTIYVGPQRQDDALFEQIIKAKPKRVIFNPDTENPERYKKLNDAGIKTIEACTLVLLRTNEF